MTLIRRDIHARRELHREIVDTDPSVTCDWCGNHRQGNQGGRAGRSLFKYHYEHDGGRREDCKGLFCSTSCFDSYHSG